MNYVIYNELLTKTYIFPSGSLRSNIIENFNNYLRYFEVIFILCILIQFVSTMLHQGAISLNLMIENYLVLYINLIENIFIYFILFY